MAHVSVRDFVLELILPNQNVTLAICKWFDTSVHNENL